MYSTMPKRIRTQNTTNRQKEYRAENYERHLELSRKHGKTYHYYRNWEDKIFYSLRHLFD